jgi:hypothetical protein
MVVFCGQGWEQALGQAFAILGNDVAVKWSMRHVQWRPSSAVPYKVVGIMQFMIHIQTTTVRRGAIVLYLRCAFFVTGILGQGHRVLNRDASYWPLLKT